MALVAAPPAAAPAKDGAPPPPATSADVTHVKSKKLNVTRQAPTKPAPAPLPAPVPEDEPAVESREEEAAALARTPPKSPDGAYGLRAEEDEEEEKEEEAAQPKKRKAKGAPILTSQKKRAMAPAAEGDDEEDAPLKAPLIKKAHKKRPAAKEADDVDEDVPLTKAPLIKKSHKKRPAAKEVDDEGEDEEEGAPLTKKIKHAATDRESEVRGVCRHCSKNVTTDQDRLKEADAPYGYLHKDCAHRFIQKTYPQIPPEQIDTVMVMSKRGSIKEGGGGKTPSKASHHKKCSLLPGASVLLPPKPKKIKGAKVKSTVEVKKRQHRDKGAAEFNDEDDDVNEDDFEARAPKKQKHAKAPKQDKKDKKEKSDVKRPLSAYLLFSNEHCEDVKANNPEFGMTDVAKAMGQLWRDADESDREPFVTKAQALKEEHERLHPREERDKAPTHNKKAPTHHEHKEHKHKEEKKAKGPKPPPNAFMLFAAETRPSIKADHPEFGMPETSAALSELWKTIDPEKKKAFILKASELKDEWKAKAQDSEGAEDCTKTMKKADKKKVGATSEPKDQKEGKEGKVKIKLGGLFAKKPKPAPKADVEEGGGAGAGEVAEEQNSVLEAPVGAAAKEGEGAAVEEEEGAAGEPPHEGAAGEAPPGRRGGGETFEEEEPPDDAVAAAILLLSGDLDARAEAKGADTETAGGAEILLHESEGADVGPDGGAES